MYQWYIMLRAIRLKVHHVFEINYPLSFILKINSVFQNWNMITPYTSIFNDFQIFRYILGASFFSCYHEGRQKRLSFNVILNQQKLLRCRKVLLHNNVVYFNLFVIVTHISLQNLWSIQSLYTLQLQVFLFLKMKFNLMKMFNFKTLCVLEAFNVFYI